MATYYTYLAEEIGFKFVLDSEIAASVQWDESSEFPPLPPKKAIELGRSAVIRMLSDIFPGYEPVFESCALTRKIERNCWYYIITWRVPDPDPELDDGYISVPVFFNGTSPIPVKFRYEDRFLHYRT